MSGNASYNNVVGIAVEATEGTAVDATDFIPVIAPKFSAVPSFAEDTAWRGSMVTSTDQILGTIHGEIDFGGPAYADTIGYLFQSILPDLATTGSADPFTTTFAALNSGTGQPTTYTLTSYDGAQTLEYPGSKFSDLSLTYTADGLVSYSAKAMSLKPVAASNPTSSFSSVKAFAGWAATVSIGGSTRSSNQVLDAEVDFKRAVTVVPGITASSTPILIWSGALEVTGKLTFIYDDDTDYNNMINNTQPSLSLDLQNGTGASGTTEIKLFMTKCAYTAAQPDPGADFMKMAVTFTARANTTDVGASGGYSPIKVTLKNANDTGTYA